MEIAAENRFLDCLGFSFQPHHLPYTFTQRYIVFRLVDRTRHVETLQTRLLCDLFATALPKRHQRRLA